MVMAKIDDCHDRTSSIRRLSNVYLRLGQAKGSLLIAPVTNPDGAGSSPGYHNFDVFRPLKCGHPMARKRPSEPLRTVFCLMARSFTVQLPTSLEASNTSQGTIIPMYNHVHPKHNFILKKPT